MKTSLTITLLANLLLLSGCVPGARPTPTPTRTPTYEIHLPLILKGRWM